MIGRDGCGGGGGERGGEMRGCGGRCGCAWGGRDVRGVVGEEVLLGCEPGERGGGRGIETCGEGLCASAGRDSGSAEDEVWELEVDVCGECVIVDVVVWSGLVVVALVGLEIAGEGHGGRGGRGEGAVRGRRGRGGIARGGEAGARRGEHGVDVEDDVEDAVLRASGGGGCVGLWRGRRERRREEEGGGRSEARTSNTPASCPIENGPSATAAWRLSDRWHWRTSSAVTNSGFKPSKWLMDGV